MNSVGIDLHRNRSHVAVIDEQRRVVAVAADRNDRETFLELLGGLEGETQVAVEATYGWEWLAELLEDAAMRSISPTRCAPARSPRRG